MKAKCNACGASFAIKPEIVIIAQDEKGKNVTWEFFTCPRCRKRYTFSVQDEAQREMIDSKEPIEKLKIRENMLKMKYGVE